MKNTIKIAIISLLAVILFSCKSKEKFIYVPQIKTEYKTNHTRDSVYLKDSVYIHQRGDTVFKNHFRLIYKDKFRTDTLIRADTISVIMKLKEEIKVNYLTSWQVMRLKVFDWLIVVLLAVLIYVFRIPIWKLIKLILRIP